MSVPPSEVIQLVPAHAMIRPWPDPIVDDRGHDPRSAYVERYWLSVIGPTATWIMRRFADEFDQQPDGFVLDLAHTATTMGMSFKRGLASPFGKAIHRCVMFGLAQPLSDGFAVRRRVPSVAQRHLQRLPDDVQEEHTEWATRVIQLDRADIEQRLLEAGLRPGTAARAADAALRAS